MLATAARDLVAKIAAVVPENLRPYVTEPGAGTPPYSKIRRDGLDIARTREWIHAGRKLQAEYCDEQGETTQRLIWPIKVGYLETVRILIAWCELRGGFRTFRTDRVVGAEFLEERHGQRAAALWSRWLERRQLRTVGS